MVPPAVATADAIVTLDGHGHSRVLARTDITGEILGVDGDRVARRIAADRLRVTSLRADDPVYLEIYAVTAAGPVGPGGSLWLRADGDPPGAVRILRLDGYQGRQRLAATFLPVLSISFPPGALPVVLAAQRAPGDWPQWRGPARDGVATSFRQPETWPAKLNERWLAIVGLAVHAVGRARTGRELAVLDAEVRGSRATELEHAVLLPRH